MAAATNMRRPCGCVLQDNEVPQVKAAARQSRAKARATTFTLLPLVALAGGLAPAPSGALELGDLTVQSHLGQPLRASIAYALAPNEQLSDSCVSVGGGRSTSSLPGIGRSTLNITGSAIIITGQSVVREPMLGTRVTINCPYAPNLSREYMLLVDPATVATERAAQSRVTPAPIARPEPETMPQQSASAPVARTAPVDNAPIGQSTRYQVQSGDTLSGIARKYGTSVKSLRSMNGLSSRSSLIRVGQKLTVSGGASDRVHVVARGDTLSHIAIRYGVRLADLLRANGLSLGSLIQPGQRGAEHEVRRRREPLHEAVAEDQDEAGDRQAQGPGPEHGRGAHEGGGGGEGHDPRRGHRDGPRRELAVCGAWVLAVDVAVDDAVKAHGGRARGREGHDDPQHLLPPHVRAARLHAALTREEHRDHREGQAEHGVADLDHAAEVLHLAQGTA